MQYLLVGIGGFCGAIARYGVGRWLVAYAVGFPLATLVVNVVGSFLIGLLAGMLAMRSGAEAEIRLLLIVGFLGAFTTFSSFSLETLTLLQTGHVYKAGINVLGNVLLCLLAVVAGALLARQIFPVS